MSEKQTTRPRYWVHFKTLKAGARFEPILKHYKMELKGEGADRQGHCPFHGNGNSSLHINLDKNVFDCADCGASGNVLDFVGRMEKVEVREAATIAAGICGIGLLPDDQSDCILKMGNGTTPPDESRPITEAVDEPCENAMPRRELFDRATAEAKIGKRVRSLIEFSGVPVGTSAVVFGASGEHGGYSLAIQWILPEKHGKPLVDWFTRDEYEQFLIEI